MSIEGLAVFAATELLLSLTPGPAVLLTVSYGLKSGWPAALAAGLGVNAGNGIYLIVSALGLGAILSTSEAAFQVVKYLGAAYLIFLGARTIWNAGHTDEDTQRAVRLIDRPFFQAVLTQLGNPKSVLFFGALLPQFIDTKAPLVPQYAVLALICFATEMPVLAAYGWIASQGRKLGNSPVVAIWRDRVAGGVLIFVGGLFAVMRRGA